MARERTGIEIDGVKWFPRTKPAKMLRIFRTKFKRLEEAIEEIGTVLTSRYPFLSRKVISLDSIII